MTPDHGPRVRWVSVLTDAPLKPTGTPMEPRCGDCTACFDICPQRAFTGRMFDPDEPRETRFAAAACDLNFREQERETGVAVCGLCLYACPMGKRTRQHVPISTGDEDVTQLKKILCLTGCQRPPAGMGDLRESRNARGVFHRIVHSLAAIIPVASWLSG